MDGFDGGLFRFLDKDLQVVMQPGVQTFKDRLLDLRVGVVEVYKQRREDVLVQVRGPLFWQRPKKRAECLAGLDADLGE